MKKNDKRRYFLHKEIKKFRVVDVHKKQVDVTDEFIDNLTVIQKSFLFELGDDYGYNLQFVIK